MMTEQAGWYPQSPIIHFTSSSPSLLSALSISFSSSLLWHSQTLRARQLPPPFDRHLNTYPKFPSTCSSTRLPGSSTPSSHRETHDPVRERWMMNFWRRGITLLPLGSSHYPIDRSISSRNRSSIPSTFYPWSSLLGRPSSRSSTKSNVVNWLSSLRIGSWRSAIPSSIKDLDPRISGLRLKSSIQHFGSGCFWWAISALLRLIWWVISKWSD